LLLAACLPQAGFSRDMKKTSSIFFSFCACPEGLCGAIHPRKVFIAICYIRAN
jgi:hypothetical protein